MLKRFSLNKRQKRERLRLVLTAIFTVLAALLIKVFSFSAFFSCLLILPIYAYIGYDILWAAISDIGHGQIFGEKLLMAIATIGALFLGEYVEAVAVLLFFNIGELFESVANGEARKSLSALAKLCPDEATALIEGETRVLSIDEIEVGTTLLLAAGDRLSLDSVITEGEALVDLSSLTGESLPRLCRVGDRLPAGALLLDAPLTVVTEKKSDDSATARILAMMEDALLKKGKSERFMTKFSSVYTPIVVFSALFLAFLCPMFASGSYTSLLPEYVRRALTFLVVSCPCALVISLPLAFFSASGRGAKAGIIFKSNAAIERLAKTKVASFDKTGTLTSGDFSLIGIEAAEGCRYRKEELCEIASALESISRHPLARAFSGIAFEKSELREAKEYRGRGLQAIYRGRAYRLGSFAYASENASFFERTFDEGSVLYLTEEGRYLAAFLLADTPKESALSLSKRLSALSVEGVILSGDSAPRVEKLARSLGFAAAHGTLLPENKVEKLEEFKKKGVVVYAGDGINDAPSLAAADISFAMGALGRDIAIEAADAVICDDDPEKVAFSIALSRFTVKRVIENLTFAISVKLLILILAAFGITSLWLAIFADVGVLILAILNAMRALAFKVK